MSLRQYLELCEAWEKHPSTERFSRVVAGADVLSRSQKELARQFEVAESTVSRWAKGYARPHLLVQQHVVSSLKKHAVRAVRAAEPQPAVLVPACA
jgi:predicted transcriptional regulator